MILSWLVNDNSLEIVQIEGSGFIDVHNFFVGVLVQHVENFGSRHSSRAGLCRGQLTIGAASSSVTDTICQLRCRLRDISDDGLAEGGSGGLTRILRYLPKLGPRFKIVAWFPTVIAEHCCPEGEDDIVSSQLTAHRIDSRYQCTAKVRMSSREGATWRRRCDINGGTSILR